MVRKKYAAPTPWEIAKPLLEKDILERRVTDDMMPRFAKLVRPEHGAVGSSWGSNYRRLQESVRKHRSRAFKDAAACSHDKEIYGLAKDCPNLGDWVSGRHWSEMRDPKNASGLQPFSS